MTNYIVPWTIRLCFPLLLLVQSCSLEPARPGKLSAEPILKPATHTVEISQMKFNPSELKVRKGDQIIFINQDMVTHDVTEETKKAWRSPPLAPGEKWVFTAMEPASYYCSIHVVMKGKIRIE